jgi:hypothetical protein
MTWVPPSCTLPTADQPLRVAELDDLLTTAVTGTDRPAPERLTLRLKPAPEVAATTAGLATRETACCSFFTFALTVAAGELTLDVTVPPAHVAVLDALEGRAG